MEVETGVAGQPGLYVLVPPGGVVVGYDVHGEALGHLPVDLLQEVQQLVVGVLGQAWPITLPVSTSRAANRVVVPWRL